MREIAFGQDGSYSAEAIVNRANAELANSFGNLAQRTLSMIAKNMDGKLEEFEPAETDKALLNRVREACAKSLPQAFERLAFSVGLEDWIKAVYSCNQYVKSACFCFETPLSTDSPSRGLSIDWRKIFFSMILRQAP